MTKYPAQLLIRGRARIHTQVWPTPTFLALQRQKRCCLWRLFPRVHPQRTGAVLSLQGSSQQQEGPLCFWQQQAQYHSLLLGSCYLVSLGYTPPLASTLPSNRALPDSFLDSPLNTPLCLAESSRNIHAQAKPATLSMRGLTLEIF